jgi:hypothetical protein
MLYSAIVAASSSEVSTTPYGQALCEKRSYLSIRSLSGILSRLSLWEEAVAISNTMAEMVFIFVKLYNYNNTDSNSIH